MYNWFNTKTFLYQNIMMVNVILSHKHRKLNNSQALARELYIYLNLIQYMCYLIVTKTVWISNQKWVYKCGRDIRCTIVYLLWDMHISTASSTLCRKVSSDVNITNSWAGDSSNNMPVILGASAWNTTETVISCRIKGNIWVVGILGCYLQDILVNGYSKLNRKIT